MLLAGRCLKSQSMFTLRNVPHSTLPEILNGIRSLAFVYGDPLGARRTTGGGDSCLGIQDSAIPLAHIWL